jgi:signal transduction histidine kinase
MTRASEEEAAAAAARTASASDRRDGKIREAREQDQEQAEKVIDSERRDVRDTQSRIDTQRREFRDAQDRIEDQADTQRRDAREAQDQIEKVQDSDREDAQDRFDARRDSERRDTFEQIVTGQQHTGQLEEANQELETFAYTVSHDLRATLRAMNGYSAALQEDLGPALGEEGQHYAERIQAVSQQMSQLIDALLRLTHLSRAQIRLHLVDLGAEATAIATELQATNPHRRVHFTIQQPARALADPQLIRTVLRNLLDNAWKFTSSKKNASIELTATPDGDTRTRFHIRDNGIGFDRAQASTLFSPFRRLSPTSQLPGTGLVSVRQIIERHGGSVQATGATGEGATFSFTLTTTHPA